MARRAESLFSWAHYAANHIQRQVRIIPLCERSPEDSVVALTTFLKTFTVSRIIVLKLDLIGLLWFSCLVKGLIRPLRTCVLCGTVAGLRRAPMHML